MPSRATPKTRTATLPPLPATYQRAFIAFDLECDMTLEELHALRDQLTQAITHAASNAYRVTNATAEPLPAYADAKPDAVLFIRSEYMREGASLPSDMESDISEAKERLSYHGCCTNAHLIAQPVPTITRTSF